MQRGRLQRNNESVLCGSGRHPASPPSEYNNELHHYWLPDEPPSLEFLPGDTLSIQAYASGGAVVYNPVQVSWSMDYAIDSADAF